MHSDARFARAVGLAFLLMPVPAHAQLFSREEALASVFPGAEIRPERVFLTETQQQRAAELSGVEIPTSLVARYIATQGGRVTGRAYVDTHIVRTKRESLLVSLDAEGRIKRVDVTAFEEPLEYLPSRSWMAQHERRPLTDDLKLDRAVRPMTGATLTAKAVTDACRRILAIDRALEEPSPAAPDSR